MIHLHLDLSVDPAKEQEMVRYFETVFRPAAQKFEGYIDVRMLKLRAALMGTAPAGVNYRFALAYQERRAAAEVGLFRRARHRVGRHGENVFVDELQRVVV